MKYSIIVPIYNGEPYLPRCIESVLTQTYSDWELILIDDGSTDHSEKICNTYANKDPLRIRVIHQENSGVLKARRVGITASRGEYLCFLDCDDFYDTTLLEHASSLLTLYDPDLLVFGFRKMNEQGEIIETKLPGDSLAYYSGEKMKDIYTRIVTGNLSNLWNEIVKRSCVDFHSDYSLYYWVFKGEDLLQNLAFVENARSVLLVPEYLYSYCIHQTGLTRRKITSAYIQSHITVQEKLLEYCEKWGINSSETARLFIHVYIRCFRALYRDSYIHPQYSSKERKALLKFLSSGQAYSYLSTSGISRGHKCYTCLNLLRQRKLRTLSGVLYFLHFLLIMRTTFRRIMLVKKNGVTACQD